MDSNTNGNGKGFPGFLTAADIFAVPLKTEVVAAFGGNLFIQELMEGRATKVAEAAQDNVARGMQLLIACVVDPETREPIFTEAHIEQLKKVSNAELLKVIKAVNRVNGWGAVEDIVKNSEASPSDALVTA